MFQNVIGAMARVRTVARVLLRRFDWLRKLARKFAVLKRDMSIVSSTPAEGRLRKSYYA